MYLHLSHKCEIIWNRIPFFQLWTKSILLSDPHTAVFSYYCAHKAVNKYVSISLFHSPPHSLGRERGRDRGVPFFSHVVLRSGGKLQEANRARRAPDRCNKVLGIQQALTLIAKGGCMCALWRMLVSPCHSSLSPNSHTRDTKEEMQARGGVYRFAISLLPNHSSEFHDGLHLHIIVCATEFTITELYIQKCGALIEMFWGSVYNWRRNSKLSQQARFLCVSSGAYMHIWQFKATLAGIHFRTSPWMMRFIANALYRECLPVYSI